MAKAKGFLGFKTLGDGGTGTYNKAKPSIGGTAGPQMQPKFSEQQQVDAKDASEGKHIRIKMPTKLGDGLEHGQSTMHMAKGKVHVHPETGAKMFHMESLDNEPVDSDMLDDSQTPNQEKTDRDAGYNKGNEPPRYAPSSAHDLFSNLMGG